MANKHRLTRKARNRKRRLRLSRRGQRMRARRGGGNNYAAEVICNVKKEQDRMDKLKPLIDAFGITPNYFIDKSEVEGDPLYTKFHEKMTLSERSLFINFIKLLEKHKDDGLYVLCFESDAKALKDIASIKDDVDSTLKEMKDNNIDMVYLCKGHIKDIGDSPEKTIRADADSMAKSLKKMLKSDEDIGSIPDDTGKKLTDTLYKASMSRAHECTLMAPRLIQKFLNYFYTTDNHHPLDWDFNIFFNKTPDIVVAWRVPELFEQDKSFATLLNHTDLE